MNVNIDNFDYYYGRKPNLIGPLMTNTVNDISQKPVNGNTISDKVSGVFTAFYDNYIKDFIIIWSIVIIVFVFLIYRYNSIKDKPKREDREPFMYEDQVSHLLHNDQPSINPLYSVRSQEQNHKVYYPPDPLPISIPGSGMVYARDIYNEPKVSDNLNSPNYDYNAVYKYPSRTYYNGTLNTYENAQDTNIVNPYGWSNAFNTTTGNFVTQMTGMNNDNVTNYRRILDNTSDNLTESLKIGPKYLDSYNIEPPYSDVL
jgi:hypothetical protein